MGLAGGIALVAIGLLLLPRLARALRSPPVVVFALELSLGFAVLATLTPTALALQAPVEAGGTCDLGRFGLPPLDELTSINDTSRNVALFVPFGLCLGLLSWTRRAASLVVLAYALPFVIELLQLLLPALGRGCQGADVVDNALGLPIGLVTGILLRLAAGSRQGHGAAGVGP